MAQPAPRPEARFPRIGIYSVSGAGKTSALETLKRSRNHLALKEGSEAIAEACVQAGFSGLDAFKKMDREQQDTIRDAAIQILEAQAADAPMVVAGHYSFLKPLHGDSEQEIDSASFDVVMTAADLSFFTHIIYLAPSAETVVGQWERDNESGKRHRGPPPSATTMSKWMQFEIRDLFTKCIENGVFFMTMSPDGTDSPNEPSGPKLSSMLDNFMTTTESSNREAVLAAVRSHFQCGVATTRTKNQVVLVIDGDRTLSADDTGSIYWSLTASGSFLSQRTGLVSVQDDDPLRHVFKTLQPEYCFNAFRQASMLYSSVPPEQHVTLCSAVAERADLQPEWVSFLRSVLQHDAVEAVVVTSGLAQVWQRLLDSVDLPCKVFGACTLSSPGFVITPDDKAAIVELLRSPSFLPSDMAGEEAAPTVLAFGDSALDIPMLKAADHSFLVVADPEHRSRSMQLKLPALAAELPSLLQIPLPRGTPPRTSRLPQTTLAWVEELVAEVLAGSKPLLAGTPGARQNGSPASSARGREGKAHTAARGTQPSTVLESFGDSASAAVIASRMRDARVSGAALRAAHADAGRFLASKLIDRVGAATLSIQHVLGAAASGHRPVGCGEGECLVVVLMRAGLPMAMAAAEVLGEPAMAFVTDPRSDEKLPELLQGRKTVVVVDAVINNGTTVREAVRRIASLLEAAEERTGVGIFVLAGTVQAGAVVGLEAEFGPLGVLSPSARGGSRVQGIWVLALRTSETKFTGTGATDTGNRLFNTIALA